jgi:hypothetical protein
VTSELSGWQGIPQIVVVTKVTMVTKAFVVTKVAWELPTQTTSCPETHVGLHVECVLLSNVTTVGMGRQMLVAVLNIGFHKNRFSCSWVVACGQELWRSSSLIFATLSCERT